MITVFSSWVSASTPGPRYDVIGVSDTPFHVRRSAWGRQTRQPRSAGHGEGERDRLASRRPERLLRAPRLALEVLELLRVARRVAREKRPPTRRQNDDQWLRSVAGRRTKNLLEGTCACVFVGGNADNIHTPTKKRGRLLAVGLSTCKPQALRRAS